MPSHEEEEIVIILPNIKETVKIIFEIEFITIKKRS